LLSIFCGFASHLEVSIDDKRTNVRASDFHQETLMIDIFPGWGTHAWKLEAAKNSKEP
jgi:hypothetical protein